MRQRLSTLAEKATLAELIQQNQAKENGAADAVVVRLVERLSKLRPNDASADVGRAKLTAPALRLVFACPNCNKALKVKSELAGRKVKCPGCQQPFCVPSVSEDIKQRNEPVAQPDNMETVSLDAKNLPSTSTIDGGKLPSRVVEPRRDCVARLDENKELYDFLAPRKLLTSWADWVPTGFLKYWARAAWGWSCGPRSPPCRSGRNQGHAAGNGRQRRRPTTLPAEAVQPPRSSMTTSSPSTRWARIGAFPSGDGLPGR